MDCFAESFATEVLGGKYPGGTALLRPTLVSPSSVTSQETPSSAHRARSLIKRLIAKRSGIVPGEAASRKPRVSPSSDAHKMSAAAALTPSRVFLMCALVRSLAATPRSTASVPTHSFASCFDDGHGLFGPAM